MESLMRLYDDLAHTYTLLTPRQDYEDEAAIYERLIRELVGSGRISLLERLDLDALAETCWVHLRPGGVALVAPDEVSETLDLGDDSGGTDGEGEGVRYLAWSWHPEGQPERTVVDYVIMHRRGEVPPQVYVDRHHCGLFPAAIWRAAFERQGFVVEQLDEGIGNVLFRSVRPLE